MARGDKYISLSSYLGKEEQQSITLSFDEISSILGFQLPASATTHERWWMNDPGHSQAASWLGAGYKKSNLDMGNRIVTFTKE